MNLRKTSVLFIMLLLLSGSMIVWAWSSLENRSFGASYGTVDEAYTQEVWLEKLEKDIDGEETDIPIEGAEFYLYEKDSVEQLSGPYLTDENGKIVLNLPPGEYCFKETHLPPNYTYDIDDDLNPMISYCFTVDEVDDEAENEDEKETIVVIAYNRRLSGPLTISKIVDVSKIADEYLEYYDADLEFKFTVTFSDNGTYYYRIDDGPEQTLTSGETLFLKDGERAIFERLPVGISYLVVETPVPAYTIASDNHQGIITEEGNEVIFVNTAKPPSLIVEKEVRGNEIDPEQVFEFVAIIDDEEIPFELKNGESKIFVDLPVGAPYEVWEIDPIGYGYIAVPEKFTGVVLNHTITLPFINYIETESDEMGELQIGKIVVGEEIDSDQRFTFEVTLENLPDDLETITVDGEPMDVTPADHTFEVSLAHEETILIEGLPPGVIYTVEERPTPGYTSGIVSQTGTIVADQAVEAWFINERYEIEETTTLRVRKVVEGEVPETEENLVFDFTLEIDGEIYERFTLEDGEEISFTDLPIGGTYLVQEVDIPKGYVLASVENGTGTLSEEEIVVTFTNQYIGRIMIELDGTKTWELNEYEVDLPEYIIVHLKHDDVIIATAKVTPDEDNEWLYSFTVPKYDEDGNEIEYTIEEVPIDGWLSVVEDLAIVNHYITPVVSDEILVTKRVTGDEPSDPHEFQFILQPIEEAPLPTSGNRLIDILGEGQASFETITFYQPGTYQYVISEIHTEASGYTYDIAKYVLTFVVQEVEGVLVITSQTLTKDNESASDIVFVNIYTENELIGTPTQPERPLPVPVTPVEPPPVPEVLSPVRPPQTNDPTSLLKWASLFLISLIGLIINLLLTRKRNRRNSE